MFDSPTKLLLGLVTGILFGVLLQKGRVSKFEAIVGQFLFKDWTVVRMMGTAVVVGSGDVRRSGNVRCVLRTIAACYSGTGGLGKDYTAEPNEHVALQLVESDRTRL